MNSAPWRFHPRARRMWRRVKRQTMRHVDKTYCVSFTPSQSSACRLRRRIQAGLAMPEYAVPELVELLYGEDYTASTVAADVLGELGRPEAVLPLIETVLWNDAESRYFNRRLRCAAIEALLRLGPTDDLVSRTLQAATHDPDPEIREAAKAALESPRRDIAVAAAS